MRQQTVTEFFLVIKAKKEQPFVITALIVSPPYSFLRFLTEFIFFISQAPE